MKPNLPYLFHKKKLKSGVYSKDLYFYTYNKIYYKFLKYINIVLGYKFKRVLYYSSVYQERYTFIIAKRAYVFGSLPFI